MSLRCDGIRCGKCLNNENCSCLMEWPNKDDRDTEKFYYDDDYQLISPKVKNDKPLVNLDDFDIEE